MKAFLSVSVLAIEPVVLQSVDAFAHVMGSSLDSRRRVASHGLEVMNALDGFEVRQTERLTITHAGHRETKTVSRSPFIGT